MVRGEKGNQPPAEATYATNEDNPKHNIYQNMSFSDKKVKI